MMAEDNYSSAVALTVVIPTHKRSAMLGRTLASLAACLHANGYRETVVVENGERSGADAVVVEVARLYPHLRLRYVHVEQANKSAALNAALATVREGVVVFFDDDIIVGSEALMAYARAAANNPEGAFFGGPFSVDYEVPPPEWLHPFLPFSARGVDFSHGERPDDYVGFNWAAYVKDLRAVGLFNPDFGPGSPSRSSGQEAEIQWRLREAGIMPVDVKDARVRHYVPLERCSPEWAAERRYRKGLAIGQVTRERRGLLLVRSMSRAFRSGAVWVLKATIREDIGRWRALFAWKYYTGIIYGIKLSNNTGRST